MKRTLLLVAITGALLAIAPLQSAHAGPGPTKSKTTASTASAKRPNSRKAKARTVGFRISPANQRKKAELAETRKNFRPTASHRMKRRKSGNSRRESSSSDGSRQGSSFDSRRGARDFNDSRTKRYGQRDLPTISTADAASMSRRSLRSSASSVLTRQPTAER